MKKSRCRYKADFAGRHKWSSWLVCVMDIAVISELLLCLTWESREAYSNEENEGELREVSEERMASAGVRERYHP